MKRPLRHLLPILGAFASPACLPVDDLSEYSQGTSRASVQSDVHADTALELPDNLTPTTGRPDDVGGERSPTIGSGPPPPSTVGPKAATDESDAGSAPGDGGIGGCAGDGELLDAVNQVCYRLSTETASWPVARGQCEALGERLVTISSAVENALLDAGFGVTFWIGANDRAVEGRFEWESGEPFDYSDFVNGDPDNLLGVQDCVEKSSPSGQWQDRACYVENLFVCEASVP